MAAGSTVLSFYAVKANDMCERPPQYAPDICKLTFDLESGIRVTCDVGYLCAYFSRPRSLCSRLRPNVRDRQTSDAHHRLMPPTLWAGHNKLKNQTVGNT